MALTVVQAGVGGTGLTSFPAPGTSGNLLTSNGSAWTSTTPAAGGKVLQVVSTAKTDTFSTSSTSFVDLNGLSVLITPASATSKFMLFVAVNGSIAAGTNQFRLRLDRNGTAIALGDTAGSRIRSSTDAGSPTDTTQVSSVIMWLDAPSTTNATTYKVQIQANVDTSSVFVNRRQDDTDNSLRARTVSTITVMEIAG
jgi:hypothetical protein